jgi:hypothetical protein
VKIPFSEYQRRGVVPLAGLALAAYYLFVLLPLTRWEESLDDPLDKAWQKLSIALEQTNATVIDFLQISNQLTETRQALLILDQAKQQATARLQLGAAVQERMRADFALVEYDNERSKQLEALGTRATQDKVPIEPAVFSSYPTHTADVKQPALLWASLALTDTLLQTALRCKVSSIQSLEVPAVLTNSPTTNNTDRLVEIPLQLEFSGSAVSATKLLQCLPLRADEIRAAALPEAPADKPPLFLDRLVVQKQSADKPDEVHVWLRAVGFVLRE